MSTDGKLKEIIDQIEIFSERCGKAEHTDTGEAWELFTDIQSKLTAMVYGRGEILTEVHGGGECPECGVDIPADEIDLPCPECDDTTVRLNEMNRGEE